MILWPFWSESMSMQALREYEASNDDNLCASYRERDKLRERCKRRLLKCGLQAARSSQQRAIAFLQLAINFGVHEDLYCEWISALGCSKTKLATALLADICISGLRRLPRHTKHVSDMTRYHLFVEKRAVRALASHLTPERYSILAKLAASNDNDIAIESYKVLTENTLETAMRKQTISLLIKGLSSRHDNCREFCSSRLTDIKWRPQTDKEAEAYVLAIGSDSWRFEKANGLEILQALRDLGSSEALWRIAKIAGVGAVDAFIILGNLLKSQVDILNMMREARRIPHLQAKLGDVIAKRDSGDRVPILRVLCSELTPSELSKTGLGEALCRFATVQDKDMLLLWLHNEREFGQRREGPNERFMYEHIEHAIKRIGIDHFQSELLTLLDQVVDSGDHEHIVALRLLADVPDTVIPFETIAICLKKWNLSQECMKYLLAHPDDPRVIDLFFEYLGNGGSWEWNKKNIVPTLRKLRVPEIAIARASLEGAWKHIGSRGPAKTYYKWNEWFFERQNEIVYIRGEVCKHGAEICIIEQEPLFAEIGELLKQLQLEDIPSHIVDRIRSLPYIVDYACFYTYGGDYDPNGDEGHYKGQIDFRPWKQCVEKSPLVCPEMPANTEKAGDFSSYYNCP